MKKLMFLLCIFVFALSVHASSFSYTYEGTSSQTIPFGSSTTPYLIYFNYNLADDLVRPKMIIAVDGELITNDLCNGTSSYLPSTFNLFLSEGVHNVQFSLLSVDPNTMNCLDPIIHQTQNETFTINFKVRVQNNFSGGDIYVDNMTSTKPAPYDKTASDGINIPVKAKNQFYDNYQRVWNQSGTNNSDWQYRRPNETFAWLSNNIQTSYSAQSNDKNTIVQANLRKICNITFSNQFSGESGGQIKVNGGIWQSAPTANYPIVEQNLIYAQAKTSYDISGIRYAFQKWSNNSTSETSNFYPSAHVNYKAIYKGYPLFDEETSNGSLRNLSITASSPHGYIKLTWDEHPNTAVTKYYVYRSYKLGSYQSPQTLIGIKNRGTTQAMDLDYEYNQDGDYTLMYDVRAYFSLDGTKSSPSPVSVKGDATNTATKIGSGEITYYDISNYPNPYNPETTIRFQLPQEGIVTIKVYNSLGEEVSTLLNEKKDYGMYELKFNGSDLPSGMYIYTIQVNDYYASKKMLLVK